jgi:hypothetical protein
MFNVVLIFCTIIIASIISGCSKTEIDYEVRVRFVDSTFVNDRETYNIGEIIHILATESVEATMPETVTVTIESGLGDVEIVKCWFRGLYTVGPRHHGGTILCQGASSAIQNNSILEIDSTNDVIHALYEVKDQTAADTASTIVP